MNNINFKYSLKAELAVNEQCYDLDAVLGLLKELQNTNNLRVAAVNCGYSYRKAWNLFSQLENLLGLVLVEKQRGKGTQLSTLGQSLLSITEENNHSLNKHVTLAAHRANKILQDASVKPPQLTIIASDSEKINQLQKIYPGIEIHIEGSGQALAAYEKQQCDVAGFHIVTGQKTYQQLKVYGQRLNQKQDKFVLLEKRQQGIISHPKAIGFKIIVN